MQIHSSTLSRTCTPALASQAKETRQRYQEELEAWLGDWRQNRTLDLESESETNNPNSHSSSNGTNTILEAWAHLNYNHALQLLDQLSPIDTVPQKPIERDDQIIRNCTALARHQQKTSLLNTHHTSAHTAFFPLDWTTAHLVFSTGLALSKHGGQGAARGEVQRREGSMRRCLMLLALLEGDPAMLATGFAEVLERVCYGDDALGVTEL